MALTGLIGKKQDQTQGFLQDGTRVPLTVISAMGNMITQLKTLDKEGYNSIQLGFDIKKKPNKSQLGHSKKAGLEKEPRFFRELRTDDIQNVILGSQVQPSDVFKPGDIVDVTGVSKGKGYAGVVKRHHFKGGPRTHGQSDRERAPGSIGQTTTPGRVYRGKRMAGRMGTEKVTIKNLEVIEIKDDGVILIKGLVPGPKNGIVFIRKVENKQSLRPGGLKKFVPLYKEESVQSDSSASQPPTLKDDAQLSSTEAQNESQASLSESRLPETEEKLKTEEQSVLNSPSSSQLTDASENKTEEEVKIVEEKPQEEVKENAS